MEYVLYGMSEKHEADGKPVVVQGGKRVSGVHESQQTAQAEADRINQLRESQGNAAKAQPPAKVVQNLYGAIVLLLVVLQILP